MISYHDENLCHTCCIICIPVLVVMMQKNDYLKFDIAIFSSIKHNQTKHDDENDSLPGATKTPQVPDAHHPLLR